MKANIEVEVENEEDLKQLENELKSAINHTTHLDGEVQVSKSYMKDMDPVKLVEGTILQPWVKQQEDVSVQFLNELSDRDYDLEFVGIEFIFVDSDERFEQRSKIHKDDYFEEDYN